MGDAFAILFFILFMISMHSCSQRDHEIHKLHREAEEVKIYNEDNLRFVCERAVDLSCYYGTCSEMPIEIMKQKICNTPEDQ